MKTSENRDAAEAIRRGLHLDDEENVYGPRRYITIKPTPDQENLAGIIESRALDPLRAALAARPGETTIDFAEADESMRPGAWGTKILTRRVTLDPDLVGDELLADGHAIGLPLTFAAAPIVAADVVRMIFRRLAPSENENRPVRHNLGMRLVMAESWLWELAGLHGALSNVMPYATRVRALRWWWEPDAGRDQSPTLCIRCGQVEPVRARRRTGPPYCDHCLKTKRLERPGAIAPADRGRWWIACAAEGCTNAFVGSAQARRCSDCRLASVTASKRTPRRNCADLSAKSLERNHDGALG